MKTAILLIGLVAQAFGTGILSDIVHDTKEAGHEVAHGLHDGVQTITGRSAAELLHHLSQGYQEAQGAKEAVQNLAGSADRSGLIPETFHHVKQGVKEAAHGAHDAVSTITGRDLPMMRAGYYRDLPMMRDSEEWRIGACSLCTLEQASDKVYGAFGAIKDTISPSKSRGWLNLGGLLGGNSESLESEHGSKVTKKVESKVVAPARGLLDILGGSSSSNEQKFVKEVKNVAHDLHGNKLAEQTQKLQIQKERLFGFGSGSSEEAQKVVKDTKQVLDSQGRPIAFHDKLVEHKGRLFGFGESSSEDKKVVKEVQQVFNAYGQPVSTTSKIIQNERSIPGFDAALKKYAEEHNLNRILGIGESESAEPNQKVIKETHEILNDYGQKIGTLVKYHETVKQ